MVKTFVVAAVVCASALVVGCGDDSDGDATATVATLPTAGTIAAAPTAAPSPLGTGVTAGPPDRVELSAEPQVLVCDGVQESVVTARVFDENDVPVSDGINVRFNVVAIGTANPIDTETVGGVATTTIVGVGSGVGIVVNVAVGEVETAIRVDCE